MGVQNSFSILVVGTQTLTLKSLDVLLFNTHSGTGLEFAHNRVLYGIVRSGTRIKWKYVWRMKERGNLEISDIGGGGESNKQKRKVFGGKF